MLFEKALSNTQNPKNLSTPKNFKQLLKNKNLSIKAVK